MALKGRQPAVVGVDLDRPRLLLYRVSDGMALERALGGESFEEALNRRGFARMVAFIWAGLRHEDPRLTVDQTSKILDRAVVKGYDYAEIWNKISEALVESGLLRKPDEGEVPGTDVVAPVNSTSVPSSGNVAA